MRIGRSKGGEKMLKMLSLFTGIGSPEQALKNLGIEFELFGFSEIDKYAIKSYCAVHDVDESLNLGNITEIDILNLPCDVDLITHGSPCQDFSVAGKGKGADEGTGTRSSLMWNTVAIVEQCKPKYVIWENVPNVLSPKHIHNFEKYISRMEELGYNNYHQLLNAKYFGVPQNRNRIFVVSIRKDITKEFKFPLGTVSNIKLKDVLEDKVDEKYFLSEEYLKRCKESNFITNTDIKIIGTTVNPRAKGTNSRHWVHDINGIVGTISATDYKQPKQIKVN